MWILNSGAEAYNHSARTIAQDGGVLASRIYNDPSFNLELVGNGLPYRAAVADWFDKTAADKATSSSPPPSPSAKPPCSK